MCASIYIIIVPINVSMTQTVMLKIVHTKKKEKKKRNNNNKKK